MFSPIDKRWSQACSTRVAGGRRGAGVGMVARDDRVADGLGRLRRVSAAVIFMTLPDGSWSERLRHVAAVPNCAAARAVGLAPAVRGAAGYWPAHDRDRDGLACEAFELR